MMTEFQVPKQEVTVVFRQDNGLYIPPTGLPRELRQTHETTEKTLHRLCLDHGVNGSVDRAIPRPEDIDEETALHAYLVKPRYGELDSSEFLVPNHEVERHLEARVRLNKIDAQLIRSAYILMTTRRR